MKWMACLCVFSLLCTTFIAFYTPTTATTIQTEDMIYISSVEVSAITDEYTIYTFSDHRNPIHEICSLPTNSSLIPWINGTRQYCLIQPCGLNVYDIISPTDRSVLYTGIYISPELKPLCYMEDALYCYCTKERTLIMISKNERNVILSDIIDEEYYEGMNNVVISEYGCVAFSKTKVNILDDKVGDNKSCVFACDAQGNIKMFAEGGLPFWISGSKLCYVKKNYLYVYDMEKGTTELFRDATGTPIVIDATAEWTNGIQYVKRLNAIFYTVKEDTRIAGVFKLFTYNQDVKGVSLSNQNDVILLCIGKPLNAWIVE